MWRVILLSLVVVFIPSPLATDIHHRAECRQTADCNPSDTNLRCLVNDNDRSKRICACSRTLVYDTSKLKCVSKVGDTCEAETTTDSPECVLGAMCKSFSDRSGSAELKCHCLSGKEISSGLCQSKDVPTSLHGQPCIRNEDCTSVTRLNYLRCLKVDGRNLVCACGRNYVYSTDKKMCTIGIGFHCKIASYENNQTQPCISGAICKPNEDEHGKALREGTCCSSQDKSCAEFTPVNPEFESAVSASWVRNPANQYSQSTELYRQPCSTDSNCNPEFTSLKCLKDPDSDKKICECRQKSKYNKDKKKCFHGIGIYCDSNTPCIPGAKCKLNKDVTGKDLNEGTCTCLSSSSGMECRENSLQVSPEIESGSSATKIMAYRSGSSTNLHRQPCTTHDDCHHDLTSLRCLQKSDSKDKICECRLNALYHQENRKCYHGIGSACDSHTACIPGAECIWNRDVTGKKLSEGKCACVYGYSDQRCNMYIPLPVNKKLSFNSGNSLNGSKSIFPIVIFILIVNFSTNVFPG